jgi:hypothetical protein
MTLGIEGQHAKWHFRILLVRVENIFCMFAPGCLRVPLRWIETGTLKYWISLARKSFSVVAVNLFYQVTTYDE